MFEHNLNEPYLCFRKKTLTSKVHRDNPGLKAGHSDENVLIIPGFVFCTRLQPAPIRISATNPP